uniref:Uncharacterized protein n=1 Tax=Xiphophorus maculatus TaxID=8083 RepID=A0A3B5QT70_XIPMA
MTRSQCRSPFFTRGRSSARSGCRPFPPRRSGRSRPPPASGGAAALWALRSGSLQALHLQTKHFYEFQLQLKQLQAYFFLQILKYFNRLRKIISIFQLLCVRKHVPSCFICIKPNGLLKCESRFHSLMLKLCLCRNMRMLGRKAFWKSSSLELRRDCGHV